MRRFQHFIIILLIFTLSTTGIQSFAQSGNKTVDVASLNMRSGPGLTYDVIKKLKKGEELDILSTSGEWLEVTHEGQTGWVASWLTTNKNAEAKATSIVSQVDALNVRSGPTIGSAVLERMNTGDKAIMTSVEGEWANIEFNGTNGWVYKAYIEEITPASNAQQTPTKPATTKPDKFTVAVDTLNVRKKANLSSKLINQIHRDEVFTIKETEGNWIKIALTDKKDGWVSAFHGHLTSSNQKAAKDSTATKNVTIISNGTNIRAQATTASAAVLRADAGQQFKIASESGDWYEVFLPNGKSAYVAKWVVSTNEAKKIQTTKQKRVPGTLQGLTIVIDAGHGGNDRGTTGARGTDEKDITLPTAELLARKLKAAGANVHLTRESDAYVSLRKRVSLSHQHNADAFVSVHYDATIDPTVSGFTTYYASQQQQKLAQAVNNGLGETLLLRNRGAQPGDFFVLRENKQNAILIELGFLSNANEENVISTKNFREQATHGIYNGLLNYFNSTIQ